MSSDSIRVRLNHLHDVECRTWRKIAEMPEFNDVPAGTLCSIAKGYKPKSRELRARLRMNETIEIVVRRDAKGRFS